MPKQRLIDFTVPGTPEEVAARLEAKTRYRRFSYDGSILGRGGLGGRVSKAGFTVCDDTRDLFRRLRAVAEAEFIDEGGTTRVRGTIGMPSWLVWVLRLSLVGAVLMVSAAVAMAVTSGAGVAAGALGGLGLIIALQAAMAGLQVGNADASIEPTLAKLESILGQAPPQRAEAVEEAPRRAQRTKQQT